MNKPIIGISIGDYNGIGPEVILKTLNNTKLFKWSIPVLYGNEKILQFYKKDLELKDFKMYTVRLIDQIREDQLNIISCIDEALIQIEPGKVSESAGKAAFQSLKAACDDLDKGKIAALITAPINKKNIQSEEFNFPGHTEYLAQRFDSPNSLMLLVAEDLRMGVATGHIPLQEVASSLSEELLSNKISVFLQSLKEDFKIDKPKIAVLGLNPHAGDDGLLGKEEKEIIQPVIEKFRERGELIFGPFPADGFFGNQQFKKFDGILGMYHDQGLIPFKYMAFENGVNFTAGLPVIRTSPDHGTAYDIAGKNLAEPQSFMHAYFLALDLIKNKMEL